MKSFPRKIETIIEPEPVVEGAGVRLKRSIATRRLNYLDPFLLLDHFASTNPADYEAGFPLHPHRGIETVTYMLEGSVRHRDSLGNAGVIGPGWPMFTQRRMFWSIASKFGSDFQYGLSTRPR